MGLKKMCSYCSCNEVVDQGCKYCDKHKIKVEIERKLSYKDYKARRTDVREEQFYNSKSWADVRELGKSKTNYMDIYEYYTMGAVSKVSGMYTTGADTYGVVQGETVHHIVCLKDEGGWDNRLNPNNLIYLTYASHSIIHARYDKSIESKQEMQRLLFYLLEKYNKEFK